jgi:hypothetical protein
VKWGREVLRFECAILYFCFLIWGVEVGGLDWGLRRAWGAFWDWMR